MMSEQKILERKIDGALKDWMDNRDHECLLVTGARQFGKTFTIEQFIEENSTSHITLDFELNPMLRDIFEGDSDVDRIISRIAVEYPEFRPIPGETILFFDEIQSCPDARRSLKQFAIDDRYRVISSGSLMGLQYRSGAQDPVGYERTMEMRSLDFGEFLWAIGIDRKVTDMIRDHIRNRMPIDTFISKKIEGYFTLFIAIGGMPRAITGYLATGQVGRAIDEKRKIIGGYRTDIGKYSQPSERDRIFRVFDSVPNDLSQENKKFMFSRIIDDKATVPPGRRYLKAIQWLVDSGIVRRCEQIDNPHLPLETFSNGRSFKICAEDTGLLLATMGDEVTASILRGDLRVNKGAVMENEVAECLSKCGHDLYYFRNSIMGVDFITVMGGNVVAIEVKSGNNNRSKSLNSMKMRYGVKRRIKFERTDIHVSDDGIEHYPLFAAAFVDSMYDPPDLSFDLDGVDDINATMTTDDP